MSDERDVMPERTASGSDLMIGVLFTERLAERRAHMEKVVAGAPRGADVRWIGNAALDAAGGRWQHREATGLFAGASQYAAWRHLTVNGQTTGDQTRAEAWDWSWRIALADLLRGKRPRVVSHPNPNQDDVRRKFVLLLHEFLDSGRSWLLGFEDDAMVDGPWADRLLDVASLFDPTMRVYVQLSDGAGLHRTASDPLPEHGVFRVHPPATRTSCAYLVSRAAVRAFIDAIAKSGFQPGTGADHALQFLVISTKTRTYWAEPNIFDHGSERGLFASATFGDAAAGATS